VRRQLAKQQKKLTLRFRELKADTWDDFEELFGARGACGGCWCMWWRVTQKEFEKQKGERNRQAMKKIVASGRIPGMLAYHDDRPVGWCSVASREEFSRLERSRILKPIDDESVWSVVCFFIAKSYRRTGVSALLLQAAVESIQRRGGRIVEGYPVEPKKDKIPDVFAYHGLAETFRAVGFREVARRSDTRPIMRLLLPSRA
jgi:GNAT superfamily N-acetyltransferase